MKRVMLTMSLLAFAGCEYESRLVTEPKQRIDTSLLGTWKRQDGEAKLHILKLSKFRYFAACGSGVGVTTPCPVDDIPLFQTEFIAPFTDGTKKVKYELMYWRGLRAGDKLKLAYLNPRLVPYDTPSREKLIKAIRKHRKRYDLFQEEATFVKTEEEPDPAMLKGAELALPFLEQKWSGKEPDWEEVMRAYTR